MTWQRLTLSAWNSSIATFSGTWKSSTRRRSQKDRITGVTIGRRSVRSSCCCLLFLNEYTERRLAKVSSDYHVRFDNAYYSVDRTYLHKEVLIRATAVAVKIFSKEGDFICEWPRSTSRGQWSTAPKHLPENYRKMSEWNGAYFTRRAMTIGPNTEEVIRRILASRKLEVQTYRMCQGVLSFSRKYSRRALEETCRQALELGKTTYTFIKNTIQVVADELGTAGYNTALNDERNKGAFVMSAEASDINTLLSRSQSLAQSEGKNGGK